MFLCRARREVRDKITELEWSGELSASNKLPLTLRRVEATSAAFTLSGSAHVLMIPMLAIVLAEDAQPGTNSTSHEWCFDRGQEAQLCEPTDERCNQLRELNTEIAKSACKRGRRNPRSRRRSLRRRSKTGHRLNDSHPTVAREPTRVSRVGICRSSLLK
jgi:hypothetical protein